MADKRARENFAKANRMKALRRHELREQPAPREAPAGLTSFPIKRDDPATRALIDQALASAVDQAFDAVLKEHGDSETPERKVVRINARPST